jgi:hypothetical protein
LARRPSNRLAQDTLLRIISLTDNLDFVLAFELLWKLYQLPRSNKNIRKRKIVRGRFIYSGWYYDLREICDQFDLPMEPAAEFLLVLLSIVNDLGGYDFCDGPVKTLTWLKSTYDKGGLETFSGWFNYCPPEHYWQYYRMARIGAGLPTRKEVEKIASRLGTQTAHGKQRDYSKGLPVEVIAEIKGVSERTVRQAIHKCWDYLALNPDEQLVIDRTKLKPGQVADLINKAQNRKNKSR